jgi:hypothetical protein
MRWGRIIPGFGTIKSFTGAAVGPTFSVPTGPGAIHAVRTYYNSVQLPTVFVWEPRGGVGHASIFIQPPTGGASFNDEVGYASLFPGDDTKKTGDDGAGPQHLLPGRKLEGLPSSFKEDCQSEYEDATTDGWRLPEHIITTPQLDVLRMQAAWNAIRAKNDLHYRLMRKNLVRMATCPAAGQACCNPTGTEWAASCRNGAEP